MKSNVDLRALELHRTHRGKMEMQCKVPLKTKEDLSLAYTPGVAAPCREIAKDSSLANQYTNRGNTVAVVTDGSAVLGLGNIGPKAALPVMEGKAILLKEFGGVDAIPICLNTQDTEEIIRAVEAIAPTFGGINLEDISSPRCFVVEEELKKRLQIPVFHDDQHGTAIVVTAALINASKVVGKSMEQLRVVLNGPGAAGTAIIRMLKKAGVTDIVSCDENGILDLSRDYGVQWHKNKLAKDTNPRGVKGDLAAALKNADVFIGVSVPNIVTGEMVKSMAKNSIVFAMANPIPEILPDVALQNGAIVVGTGRSDFPNQINNLLAFPGIFRGALQVGAIQIDDGMKLAAAKSIAALAEEDGLDATHVIPNPLDPRVVLRVASSVEAYYN